ncbi:MAG TPA: HigA family addiction module antitoxin [Myxococcota bacterium]|nr:HigA family addiction module antitoxin [Myxococcota bacterium]HOD00154.1 HigA family addiction module antitoxin [Myxococcota bacterium]HOH76589.1 HigA family addiction module antitoxin [Myxococcota bacterium]
MRPSNRIPTHPGVILATDFLKPLGITQMAFAAHLGIPIQRLNELIRGKRGVTPDTAWLLSQALGTTPDFWMNLQAAHDLAACRPVRKIKPLHAVRDDAG